MDIVVSFAIATYNRKTVVSRLIENLLSVNRNDIEIVVVDDCSTDGTVDTLNKINDKRLRIFEHECNTNGKMTWYDAYENSNGEWIFYINDRDWVNVNYVSKLVETLCELAELNVGFAIAGEKWELFPSEDYILYDEGRDTIFEFGLRDQHPTGQIIRKCCWEQIDNRKDYFCDEKYGIYPHGYIEAIIGNKYKGAYILYDICDQYHYTERLKSISTSGIYRNSRGEEYFWPQKRYEILELLMNNIQLVNDRGIWNDFILFGYRRAFRLATIAFMYACNDEIIKRRYGYPDIKVTDQEILKNGMEFVLKFRLFLEEKQFDWIHKDFFFALESVELDLLQGLIQWIDFRKVANSTPLYDRYVIFGAGIQGKEALLELGEERVFCFCDNSEKKWKHKIGDKEILSFQEANEKYGSIATFLITPVSSNVSTSIAKQLCSEGVSFRFWR